MIRVVFFVIAMLAAMAPSSSEELLKKGDVISGPLRFFQSQHPNGTWIPVYQVKSDNPRNFAEKDEFCPDDHPPVTFHIVPGNDKAKEAQLKKFVGKKVSIVLEDFFCSETAWHIGDAVVFGWHLAEPAAR